MEGAYRCWRGGAGLSGHGKVERGGMTTGGRQMLPFLKGTPGGDACHGAAASREMNSFSHFIRAAAAN